MLPQEIIRRKRDGGELTDDEIAFVVKGITDGSITEGQAAAFAMAVFLRGMEPAETVALTRQMMASGTVIDWTPEDLPGPVLDKHSTGGVGDKVSLLLAPMIAACGGYVPMISGRGLGHTGGTLDKLDSIPGYATAPDLALLQRTVKTAGCTIIGQTPDLAPADRRLYAIRDVTATVESIPLITASILSKKLAAGLNGLVMDVKTGSGAFADSLGMARDLAGRIVSVANGAGLPTTALITDMNQVLGRTAGNALEVRECVDYLKGSARDARLHEVTMALCSELLVLSGLAQNAVEAGARLEAVLADGSAAERFSRMVAELGGPADFLDKVERHLPKAPMSRAVRPERPGFVTAMDTRAMGLAVVEMGGGRRRADDLIDYAVGLSECCALGENVGPDRPLIVLHGRTENDLDRAEQQVRAAIALSESAPSPQPVVIERIDGSAS